MVTNIRRFFLLTLALLFCVLGCTRDRGDVLMPDHVSPPMDVHESVDVKASFEHDLLPILTARCALSGCHVADGPHGLDFRTYESFVAGGEHGPAYIPGNAAESEIIEQIASGTMPPGGPPLSAAKIQLFVDWINQQEPQDDIVLHDDHHDEEEDVHADDDDDHEDHDDAGDDHADDEDGHEDIDNDDDHDDHDDGDDDHDDNEDENDEHHRDDNDDDN